MLGVAHALVRWISTPRTRTLPSASARAACSVAGSTRMLPRWPMSDQVTRAQWESSAQCSAGAAPSCPSRSTMLRQQGNVRVNMSRFIATFVKRN